MDFLNPAAWARPSGYSNGVAARGRLVFLAGQIGWDAEQRLVSDSLAGQAAQAMANIAAILAEAGGRPEHVVRLTWYVTSKVAYLASTRDIGQAYRAVFGSHYPTMTLVEVADLLEDGAHVEIEATAVIPDDEG
ncbi:MAG TPA: RidA family protein [Rhodothermales bacterium]|nr:RidA family protein [Rhodothermales bacterium]